jgi:hypothetical protein
VFGEVAASRRDLAKHPDPSASRSAARSQKRGLKSYTDKHFMFPDNFSFFHRLLRVSLSAVLRSTEVLLASRSIAQPMKITDQVKEPLT